MAITPYHFQLRMGRTGDAPPVTKTLIIGASGAIGQQLSAALVRRNGRGSVVCAVHRTPLPHSLSEAGVLTASGVDVRDAASLARVIAQFEPTHVWNLAAPLSVDTDKDPALAHDITVGGMRRIIDAMASSSACRTLLFSDSIGSFGSAAPRLDVAASWLVAHPAQDPGSDYGRQKRECRELMERYAATRGIDTRWLVIPGVLHPNDAWGGGTTEYALDAVKWAAVQHRLKVKEPYQCPINLDERLPMIFVTCLIRAMILLQVAPRESLREPSAGYCAAGFSFTPRELFALLRQRVPSFRFVEQADGAAARFAALWPDTISGEAAQRDLGFHANVMLPAVVDTVLAAHRAHFSDKTRSKL